MQCLGKCSDVSFYNIGRQLIFPHMFIHDVSNISESSFEKIDVRISKATTLSASLLWDWV